MKRWFHRFFALGALLGCAPVLALGPQVLILRGAGGEPRYDERFSDWAHRLAALAVDRCGSTPDRVVVAPADGASPLLTRESAAAALSTWGAGLSAGETALIVLIGHGSVQREAKFMVSGPDIPVSEFAAWVDALPPARLVIVNAASASAPFINALSRPGRVIVTSTRGPDQPNATEFMEHMIATLGGDSGDRNRDGRLTLAEWCDASAAATLTWYEQERFVVTENALIDDNGDGLGTRLPLAAAEGGQDGAESATIVIREEPALRAAAPEAVARYREAIQAVEAWKAQKATVESGAYWKRLEELLLEAARLNPSLVAR